MWLNMAGKNFSPSLSRVKVLLLRQGYLFLLIIMILNEILIKVHLKVKLWHAYTKLENINRT